MVYIDTNIVIYALEATPGFGRTTVDELVRLKQEGHEFVGSVLLLTEFLAGTRAGNASMLSALGLKALKTIDVIIAERAGELQRIHNLGIGDSIHLATAINLGCELFFTNDVQLGTVAAQYTEVLRPNNSHNPIRSP